MTQRVRCIIINPSNKILLGRTKNKKFNIPGGKVHEKEHPVDAVLREVWEETGLKSLKNLKYLWEISDNKVFFANPPSTNRPTGKYDPDKEFISFGWFNLDKLPVHLDQYARKILDQYHGKAKADLLPGGLADKKTLRDFDPQSLREGTLIELEHTTNKQLAQEIAMDHLTEDPEYYIKLRKVEGSGNTERALQMKKVYKMIDELLKEYIPEEKARPSAEIVYKVDYLGKTVWKPMGDDDHYTHIEVNHKIVNNDDMLRQVLAHEIIHHHLYQKYGNEVAKHGEHFEMIADRINAKEGKSFVTEFANHTEFQEGNAE